MSMGTATESSSGSAHLLVFPHPAQGHLIPLLDLAYHLATRGVLITVLVTPKNLPLLDSLLSSSPSVQTLVLPFPRHPSIPPGVENIKDLGPASSTAAMVRALSALRDPIAHWFRSHPSPPVAIISDFFLGWTHDLALHLGVPRLVFCSVSPLLVSVLNHLWTAADVRPSGPTTLSAVPGSPSFDYSHLPAVYRRCQELGPPGSDWEFMKQGLIANMSSFGGVFNTFYALDGTYLEHVRKHGGNARTWAVGPLFVGVGFGGRGGSSSLPDGGVMTWLDTCPERSVVYVCFGSEVSLTRPQMHELAAGLEGSGARFVWAVRMKGENGVVPEGFEERTAGKGIVIRGWAPQTRILGHRAVGAFLTHCGWNSALEGLVSGVRLLAWPMGADQFVNARLLVEEAGVAVRVCEGQETIPDSAELARVVAESVSGSGDERAWARVLEFKKAALDALKEGGSSHVDLDGLVEELSAINLEKTAAKKEKEGIISKGNCV